MKLFARNYAVIIFFIAAALFFLMAPGKVYATDKQVLTPEFIASGEWIIWGDSEDCLGTVEFKKDGQVRMKRTDCPDKERINVSGSYKIKGNKIIIKVEKAHEENGQSDLKAGETIEAKLTDKDSLEYRWYLEFTTNEIGKVYNKNSAIKEGEPLTCKGIDAVAMGSKNGSVTTPLKIRETPDPSGKEVTGFGTCGKEGEFIPAKSLEKGKSMKIYARTKEKSKVGKWNNYWYYIGFDSQGCDDGEITVINGWVFGEFVKIK